MKKITVLLSVAFAAGAMAIPQQAHASKSIRIFTTENTKDPRTDLSMQLKSTYIRQKLRDKIKRYGKLKPTEINSLVATTPKISEEAIMKYVTKSKTKRNYSSRKEKALRKAGASDKLVQFMVTQ